MKAEIDMRAGLGQRQFPFEHAAIRLVVEEIAQYRGKAALRRIHGLGRVFRDRLAKSEMDMGVDQPWKNMPSRGLGNFPRGQLHPRRHKGGDLPVDDPDIQGNFADRGVDDDSVANEPIKQHIVVLGLFIRL